MFAPIIYEDIGTSKSSNDIFIQKCGRDFSMINLDYPSLCPFCEIFSDYYDVFHPSR